MYQRFLLIHLHRYPILHGYTCRQCRPHPSLPESPSRCPPYWNSSRSRCHYCVVTVLQTDTPITCKCNACWVCNIAQILRAVAMHLSSPIPFLVLGERRSEAAGQVQEESSLEMMTSTLSTDSTPLPHDLQPPSTDSDEPCKTNRWLKSPQTHIIVTRGTTLVWEAGGTQNGGECFWFYRMAKVDVREGGKGGEHGL